MIAVEKLVNKEWIEKIYPLHEVEDLKRLSHEWYGLSFKNFTAHQPLGNFDRSSP